MASSIKPCCLRYLLRMARCCILISLLAALFLWLARDADAQFDAGLGPDVDNAPVSAPAKPIKPISTEARVINIAARFCQAIGEPVMKTARSTAYAIFETPSYEDLREEPYRPLRWMVEFEGQADVYVVDGSNCISQYIRYGIGDPGGTSGKVEPSVDALRTFSKVILAAGYTQQDVEKPTITEMQPDDWGWTEEKVHILRMLANRLYQSIPYDEQWAIVDVQAETGHLAAFDYDVTSPPPVSNTRKITAVQAQALADAVLNKTGFQGIALRDPTLKVVEPNTQFQPRGVRIQSGVPCKVAWECAYVDRSRAVAYYYDVWIDAGNGSALGGHTRYDRMSMNAVRKHEKAVQQ